MARTWGRSELDMMILEYLYDYKSLRGTTLAKLCTQYDMQKTYDRLIALGRLGKINSRSYMEQDGRRKGDGKCGFKKRGQMYYLTSEGVIAIKEYRGMAVEENERDVEVLDNQLKSLYTSSIIIENISLPFMDGRRYKALRGLPNYVTVDLAYDDWVIFVERTQTDHYRKKHCQMIRNLTENPDMGNVMIICPTEAQAVKTSRVWKDEMGPDVRIMSRDNLQGIERLLKGFCPAEISDAVSRHKGNVAELPDVESGCTHIVNDEICMIKDLVGLPPQTMRQVTVSVARGKKKYLIVEQSILLPYITRRFPELLSPEIEFMTLDGAYETSEDLYKTYGGRRAVYA